jgi:hypothetical protein
VNIYFLKKIHGVAQVLISASLRLISVELEPERYTAKRAEIVKSKKLDTRHVHWRHQNQRRERQICKLINNMHR